METVEDKKRLEAERKLKTAPDKEKLKSLTFLLDAIVAPEMKSEEAQEIMSDAMKMVKEISIFVKQKTEAL